MDRRTFFRLTLIGMAGFLMGHSPYRQWVVYRRKRLFILTSAAEEAAFPFGQIVAQVLATYFPESQAMAARARDSLEIVKLIGSQQLDVALLQTDEAQDAFQGKGKFQEEGPLPTLRTLFVFGSYLLVCRDDFPKQKAYQIVKTLAEHEEKWKSPGFDPAESANFFTKNNSSLQTTDSIPPFHPGTLDFYEGRPFPIEQEEMR